MSTKIPAVTHLSSRIIRVLGMNPGPMTLQGTNTYIIGTGKKRLLVDTGEPNQTEYIENLKQVLQKEAISLEHIILTHWHMDHVGGLRNIFESIKPDCDNIWKFKRTEANEDPDIADEIHSADFLPPNKTLKHLTDGQVLQVEGATLKVIHTPGHTTDHVVLKLEEENALFSGDTILGEGTAVFSNLISYLQSLKLIRSVNPSVIYPAHGPVVEDPIQTIDFYIQHREERDKNILGILEENKGNPMTVEEIVFSIYSDTLTDYVKEAAKYVIRKHLDKLTTEGKISRENKTWMITSTQSKL